MALQIDNVLDDWYNFEWPGVVEGFYDFIFSERARGIVPFFSGFNKIFLTTTSYADLYQSALRDLFQEISTHVYIVPSERTFTKAGLSYLSVRGDNFTVDELESEWRTLMN